MFKKKNYLTAAIENRHWCNWTFKDINTDIKSCHYKCFTEASLEGTSLLSEEGAVVQRILLLLQQGLFFEYYDESNEDNCINPGSYKIDFF